MYVCLTDLWIEGAEIRWYEEDFFLKNFLRIQLSVSEQLLGTYKYGLNKKSDNFV